MRSQSPYAPLGRPVLDLFLLVFVSVALALPAAAQSVLDQEAVAAEDNAQLFLGVQATLAQTFSVGISGTLTGVEVKVSGGATSATFAVHPTTDGKPVFGSAPLASGTVSFDTPVFTTPVYVPVDLSAAGIQVEVGDVLAIVSGGGMNIGIPGNIPVWHRLDGFSVYSGGRYFSNAPFPYTEYADFDTTLDLGFRTFVEPAPPTDGLANFDANNRNDRMVLLYPETSGCTTTGTNGFADPACTVHAEDANASFGTPPIPASLSWNSDVATMTVSAANVESYLFATRGVSATVTTPMVFQFDGVTGAFVGGHLGGAMDDFFFEADLPTSQGVLSFEWLNRNQMDRPFEGTALMGTAFEQQVVASCATAADAPAPVDTNGMCFLQQDSAPAYNLSLNTFTVFAPRDALIPMEDYSPEFDTLDFALAEMPLAVPSLGRPAIAILAGLLLLLGTRLPRLVRLPRAPRSTRCIHSALLLGAFAGVLLLSAWPDAARAAEFEGIYELGISETFSDSGNPGQVTWHRTLRTEDGRIALPPIVEAPGTEAPSIGHGASVRIEGDIVDGVLVAGSIQLLSSGGELELGAAAGAAAMRMAAAPPSDTLGAQRTLVTLLNFTNDLSQPYTPAEVTNVLLDEYEPESLASFVREASYDRAWLSGGVAGWIPVGYDDSNCQLWSTNENQIPPVAIDLVEALDPFIDYSNLDRWIIVIPQNLSCGFVGYSSLGKETWDTDDGIVRFSRFILNGFSPVTSPRTSAHEFGHSAGALQHSLDYECGVDVVDDRCSVVSTATDRYDVISSNVPYGHFSAPNKEALHWLDSNLLEVAPPGGTFFLESYATPGTGSPPTGNVALRVPVSWVIDDLHGASGYYVSYRTPTGFDAVFPELASDGAMIHLDGDFFTPLDPPATGASRLLDLTPGGNASQQLDSEDVLLEVGQTFVDAEHGISIEVKGLVGGELEVEVLYSKYCGNGATEPEIDEVCDGADLGGATCSSIGFTSGSLACAATCDFDTSMCGADRCGPGHAFDESAETCAAEILLDPARRDIWRSSSDWNEVRDFSSGNPTYNYAYIYLSNVERPDFGNIYRNSMPFDTSVIPGGSSLVSATLDMKMLESGYPGVNTHPDSADQLVLVEAMLSDPLVATSGDYVTIGTVDTPVELAPRIDVGDESTGSDTSVQFMLNAAGLGAIDSAGYSFLGLRGGYDLDNVTIPGEENALQTYIRSEASPIAGPILTIVYDAVPEPGFGILLISGALLLGRLSRG